MTSREKILLEVQAEEDRQDQRWGEQNHPDGTGEACPLSWRGMAELAKKKTDLAAKLELLTWRDILTEEFAEAMEAATEAELRAELLQVAAVACQWVGAIDRRDRS